MPRERRDPAYKEVGSMLWANPRIASLTFALRPRKATRTISASAISAKNMYVTRGSQAIPHLTTIARSMPAVVCVGHN